MLAARGRDQAEYAVQLAKKQNAALFAIFVRTVRLLDVQPGKLPRLEDDPEAQAALGTTLVVAREAGVPFYPIYVTSPEVAHEILDYTVTFGCDTLIMGKSRRSLFARKVAGDVISQVAQHLPDEVSLVTRSAGEANPERI
jgi:nucleotide-binding universal stress UspA family protein